MNILIIILGCHVAALLQDRIHTALALANHHRTDNIYFGFSGGIKYAESGGNAAREQSSLESEARKMQKLVEPGEPYFNQWNYILDERSTNTAENFVYVRSLLEQEAFQKVYVVTSDFHAPRAQRIADGIIGNANPIEWIVAPLEFGDFRAMEQVHMRNVHNDINAALRLL
jgi:hypothetical protein